MMAIDSNPIESEEDSEKEVSVSQSVHSSSGHFIQKSYKGVQISIF